MSRTMWTADITITVVHGLNSISPKFTKSHRGTSLIRRRVQGYIVYRRRCKQVVL